MNIPTIDIYNRQFWQEPAWKEYFASDSIDAELDHPDFTSREKMRRKIAQIALNQYTADLMMFASTDWTTTELPSDNPPEHLMQSVNWNQLQLGHETVKALFSHFHRLYKD